MYSRTSNSGTTPQYVSQYPQYPAGGAGMMNPRSPAPNTNAYRPPYPSGSPYQNGITSSSSSPSTASGKPTSRPQQVSPKRSNSQPTTPPQQPRYQTPYPSYSNGPIAYKPGGSNGYAAPPPQPQQQQQQTPWPPQPTQRDAVTPGLASSTGDSDSNSSNASQQPISYPPSTMANGPTTATGYPQSMPSSYNTGGAGDSTNNNNNMNSGGHGYMDQQYSNIPPPGYGYPPQQMSK